MICVLPTRNSLFPLPMNLMPALVMQPSESKLHFIDGTCRIFFNVTGMVPALVRNVMCTSPWPDAAQEPPTPMMVLSRVTL